MMTFMKFNRPTFNFIVSQYFKDKRVSVRLNLRYCSMLIEARELFANAGEGKIHLSQDEESQIAVITIDNQQKKNALSGSMMVQLEAIVGTLESWKLGKGIILKANGDTFCSGGDISKERGIPTPYEGMLISTFMHNILTRFNTLPMVSVALVHGKAIGGGAELTTATDFRAFSTNGEVSFAQGKMGVVTGWGGGTRLTKILGHKLALDLLISSRKIKAKEALNIGYADYLTEGKDPYLDTKMWLQERLIHDVSIIHSFKKIVMGARDLNLKDSLENERKIFAPLWGSPGNLEALKKNIKHK